MMGDSFFDALMVKWREYRKAERKLRKRLKSYDYDAKYHCSDDIDNVAQLKRDAENAFREAVQHYARP